MENYRIEFSSSVEKDFNKLDKTVLKRVWSKIDELKIKPLIHNSKKLVNSDFHRVRVGDYRIIYEVDEKLKLITILKVKHRKDVYKDI
jgi:mRNA interferase RelE/StbE